MFEGCGLVFSAFMRYVASSYAGAFFLLNIGLMGALGLWYFIVACRGGAMGFMFVSL
jgi:hypothetical protein